MKKIYTQTATEYVNYQNDNMCVAVVAFISPKNTHISSDRHTVREEKRIEKKKKLVISKKSLLITSIFASAVSQTTQ